jgi:large subunit ribosomal protein L22
MPGSKTNEREGTRAVLRHAHVAPNKAREVLDLVRGRPVHEAEDILRFSERDVAFVVGKVLHSAIANAEENESQDPEELFVSACYADEGSTVKRWRPRARGRATRIRKRTTHITIIVSRLPDQELRRLQEHRRAEQLAQRARRVAGARRSSDDTRSRAERRRGAPVEDDALSELEGVDAVQDGELTTGEQGELVDEGASDGGVGETEGDETADVAEGDEAAQDEYESLIDPDAPGEPAESDTAEADEPADEDATENEKGE